MKNRIDIIKLKGRYKYIVFYNTKYIGYFYCEIDGYYVFVPDTSEGGFWSAYSLRWIADKLDIINKPWDDSIKAYFDSQSET